MGCSASSPAAVDDTDGVYATPNARIIPPSQSNDHQQRVSPRPLPRQQRFNQPLRPVPCPPTDPPFTRTALIRERTEYFDTRVTGRLEVWGAIRLAAEALCEGDVLVAQSIIDAAGITVPTGVLSDGAYDETGESYRIPAYCFGTPDNLIEDEEAEEDEEHTEAHRAEMQKSVKKAMGTGEKVRLKVRLSDRGGPDITVEVGLDEPMSDITDQIQKSAQYERPVKIRIAYMGRLLRDSDCLGDSGWIPSHIVGGFVFG